MHVLWESDKTIVAKKPTNNEDEKVKQLPDSHSAELAEPRVLAKRKAEQTPVTATQSAGQTS